MCYFFRPNPFQVINYSLSRFFGSRFDDVNNFGGRNLSEVAGDLALLATAVAKVIGVGLGKPHPRE